MIICQTLWTNKKKLLEDNFGWLSPQHHLMSWALSYLKLKKHYKVVNLHTDSGGREMLIDKLGLPYTAFFTDYDNLDCESYLWALPKLLTYANQGEPFLHVDGDVMIWEPLDEAILGSDLIAQNLELGTGYYRERFMPLIRELKYLPKGLKRNLLSADLRGYNAGIIGGSDLQFFKRFVSQALLFLKKNKDCKLNVNFNMIFEQILFYSAAEGEKKTVACFTDKIFNDNGYKLKEFADFPYADKLKYLHMIGGLKRNKEVCDMLARHLQQENEEIFLRVAALFKKQHYFYSRLRDIYGAAEPAKANKFHYNKSERLAKSLNGGLKFTSNAAFGRHIENSENTLLKELHKYEQKIHRICTKFKKIALITFKQLENDSMKSIHFLTKKESDRRPVMLYRNPHTEIILSAYNWTTMQASEIGDITIRCSENKNITIGIVPELFFGGYREIELDEMSVNIIILAETKISFGNLLEKMNTLIITSGNKNERDTLYELFFLKVEYLIKNKLLFVCGESCQN